MKSSLNIVLIQVTTRYTSGAWNIHRTVFFTTSVLVFSQDSGVFQMVSLLKLAEITEV